MGVGTADKLRIALWSLASQHPMDFPSSPSIGTHLHGSDYHMSSVCQTCGRCHCLEQECPRAFDSPVPTAAPSHHHIYTPTPERHLPHTTVCSVCPFPDPGFPFPLCPLGRLVLESGSPHPGAPSVTSYPSSQLPSASGEHGPSGIHRPLR